MLSFRSGGQCEKLPTPKTNTSLRQGPASVEWARRRISFRGARPGMACTPPDDRVGRELAKRPSMITPRSAAGHASLGERRMLAGQPKTYDVTRPLSTSTCAGTLGAGRMGSLASGWLDAIPREAWRARWKRTGTLIQRTARCRGPWCSDGSSPQARLHRLEKVRRYAVEPV
jgi:hypothetical protein